MKDGKIKSRNEKSMSKMTKQCGEHQTKLGDGRNSQ
jgi:hypothetical protein